jgi:hypothetical protein
MLHDITYIKQRKDGMCGAASLGMIYLAFGISRSQRTIWKKYRVPAGGGKEKIKTYRLCSDALEHGLHAIIIRAKDPLHVLNLFKNDDSIGMILNYRANRDDPIRGHFSVVTDITETDVILQDPSLGQETHIAKSDLIELLNKSTDARCEISGNVMMAISNIPSSKTECSTCGVKIPSTTKCQNPKCNKEIPLQPPAVLGCVDESCPERTWQHIICPHCDGDQDTLTRGQG